MDRSKNTKPLYSQLEEIIRQEIISGKYKPGDMIPREIEYQEKYNISRITARQAIKALVDEGYLKRTKGRGTEVLFPKVAEPLLKINGFTDEMKDKGIIPSTKWAKIMITKSFGEISKRMRQQDGDEVYRLRRIRCINDVPVVVFDTYIKRKIDLELNDEMYYGSLYSYLKNEKGIKIKRISQSISAGGADKDLSKLLDCPVAEPILILKREAFDEQGDIVEFTVGKYIGERYEYYFEIEEGK